MCRSRNELMLFHPSGVVERRNLRLIVVVPFEDSGREKEGFGWSSTFLLIVRLDLPEPG